MCEIETLGAIDRALIAAEPPPVERNRLSFRYVCECVCVCVVEERMSACVRKSV